MKLVSLLSLIALGCGGAPTTSTTPPTSPAGDPTATRGLGQRLEVRYRTLTETGTVAPGGTLRSGDKLALELTPTQAAYIYILQLAADGTANVLYPRPGEEAPLTGTHRLPPSGWLQLDDVIGDESFYVVASSRPLARADAAIKGELDKLSQEPAPNPPASPSSSPPPRTKTATGAKAPRPVPMLTLQNRGLVRVQDDASLQATADDNGIAVFRFDFHHVAR